MLSKPTYLVLITLACIQIAAGETNAETRPNVLFIIVDDLNDMPLHPNGKPYVPTPNFDRLAARGLSFTNAHCNDPICAPSRSSMLTGLYPQTSSLYWFEDWRQNVILSQSVTVTEHLATNGYDVFTVGKIYHGNQDPKGFYAGKGAGGNVGPWPWDGTKQYRRGYLPHPEQRYFYADDADPDMDYKWEHTFGPLSKIPNYPSDASKDVPGYRGWILSGEPFRYISDQDRDAMPDESHAQWAISVLNRTHSAPFALFTGFSRTHTPLYAPQKYFDRFPLDEIQIPKGLMAGDLEDCAPSLANRSLYAFRRFQMLHNHPDKPDLFKEWLQAYMACVSFVDEQVGTVLDALEQSEHADNTIVILTSDHGFHVGGKEALYKQTLWDSGTRIPLIVAGLEGMPEGANCDQPVSLIDIYPTLIDVCQLPPNPNRARSGYSLDGYSLKPLFLDPKATWDGPSVAITALPGKDHSQHTVHTGTLYPHFSVRSKDWRYSLTSDGQEELYHYPSDPNEFVNLAKSADHQKQKATLKEQLLQLRDGGPWEDLDDQMVKGFELTAEIQGAVEFSFNSKALAEVNANEYSTKWTSIRIRAAGDRNQVWVNNRVFLDSTLDSDFKPGTIQTRALTKDGRVRSAKIKRILPD